MTPMSQDDSEFLTSMIKHHQVALDMSGSYLAESKPTERQSRIADLARSIIKTQTAEIAKMQGWLKAAGSPAPDESLMDM